MRLATGSAMPRLETKAVEGHRSPRRWRVFQWLPNLAKRLGVRQPSGAFPPRTRRRDRKSCSLLAAPIRSEGGIDAAIFPAQTPLMAKMAAAQNGRADLPVSQDAQQRIPTTKLKSSALLDTRVVYCGDNLEQLAKLPDAYVDLIYIDPPFNSNRNYEVFWGETKEKRAFEDRHENIKVPPHLHQYIRHFVLLQFVRSNCISRYYKVGETSAACIY
jgi:hypothetical protein